MYTYKQFGNKYVISIDNRSEISLAITTFCEDFNIKAGAIYGLGAVDKATLRFFDPSTKKYVDTTFSEQMEISNLTGNISRMNGKVYLHLHVTLGRADYTSLAGHLLSGMINGAGEFVVEKFDGEVERYYNESIGLNMYKFDN
jgi:predicted DNA-binding protein with PD1-like motif